MVLDLHTSNILISLNYPPISSVATKYFHFKENTENTKNNNTLQPARNRDGECSLMQQFTHPVHPKSSYRLRTCFGGKAEKYDRRQKKYKRKKQAKTVYRTEYTGKQFSFQKVNCIATACPYQISCAAQFPKLSSLAAAASP